MLVDIFMVPQVSSLLVLQGLQLRNVIIIGIEPTLIRALAQLC